MSKINCRLVAVGLVLVVPVFWGGEWLSLSGEFECVLVLGLVQGAMSCCLLGDNESALASSSVEEFSFRLSTATTPKTRQIPTTVPPTMPPISAGSTELLEEEDRTELLDVVGAEVVGICVCVTVLGTAEMVGVALGLLVAITGASVSNKKVGGFEGAPTGAAVSSQKVGLTEGVWVGDAVVGVTVGSWDGLWVGAGVAMEGAGLMVGEPVTVGSGLMVGALEIVGGGVGKGGRVYGVGRGVLLSSGVVKRQPKMGMPMPEHCS